MIKLTSEMFKSRAATSVVMSTLKRLLWNCWRVCLCCV